MYCLTEHDQLKKNQKAYKSKGGDHIEEKKAKASIRVKLRYDADVGTFRQAFKITIINMLMSLMKNLTVDNMQNQISSLSRKMDTIRVIWKCQK